MPYSFSTRFGEETGTSPEELIAAAHAGCFSMSLAFYLERAGLVPESIATDAELSFENQSGYWTVTGVHLRVSAHVPGAKEDDLQSLAREAEKGCLVSRLLKTEITLDAGLTLPGS